MRSIELFSGAGGLALGLESAGFESVALIEKNRDACMTLRENRPGWNVVEDDIERVAFEEFGSVDLVAGGPPCQPFSMGGKARGAKDKRDMFPFAVEAVRKLGPRAFLFENVRGLMRPAFKNYVEYIRLQLSYPNFPISSNVAWDVNLARLQKHNTSAKEKGELSYRVAIHVADAADYGVPQRRHRVFFVGFRSDLDAGWNFPLPTHGRDELIHAQYVSGDYWTGHGLAPVRDPDPKLRNQIEKLSGSLPIRDKERWKTVRDAIRDLDEPGKCRGGSRFSDHFLQPGARSYPGHTGSPLDLPSKALKAGDHGVPGGENMLRYEDGSVRYFSVRESARIQTFPDSWNFSGSWTESMRQLGNAVPVRLAEVVAKSVAARISPDGRARLLQSARQDQSRQERR